MSAPLGRGARKQPRHPARRRTFFSQFISVITEILVTKMKPPRYLDYAAALMWAWSGIQPLVSAQEQSLALLAQTGIGEAFRLPLFWFSAALDIVFALLCLSPLHRLSGFWLAQLAVVAAYGLIIAFRLPEMWLHPFAPLVKNIPIMALLYFLYQSRRTAP